MITAPMESAMRFAPSRSHRVLALVIGYLLLYVGAFHFASLLDQGGFIASLWYPPAGLTAFAMLAFGWAGVALDAAGSAVAVLYAAAWQGAPLSGSELLSRMVLHAASYAAVILPLRRLIGQPAFLAQPAQAGWFLAAAGLGAALASGAGLLRLRWLGQIDAGHFWSLAATRVVGDFIGIVTLAPILLAALLPWLRRCLRDDGPDPAPRPPVEESDARVRRILLGVTAMGLLLLALGHPPPGLEILERPLVDAAAVVAAGLDQRRRRYPPSQPRHFCAIRRFGAAVGGATGTALPRRRIPTGHDRHRGDGAVVGQHGGSAQPSADGVADARRSAWNRRSPPKLRICGRPIRNWRSRRTTCAP
ncbi:MAG: hypothetical protein V9H25_05485 [Candidatus Competibacter sp.]